MRAGEFDYLRKPSFLVLSAQPHHEVRVQANSSGTEQSHSPQKGLPDAIISPIAFIPLRRCPWRNAGWVLEKASGRPRGHPTSSAGSTSHSIRLDVAGECVRTERVLENRNVRQEGHRRHGAQLPTQIHGEPHRLLAGREDVRKAARLIVAQQVSCRLGPKWPSISVMVKRMCTKSAQRETRRSAYGRTFHARIVSQRPFVIVRHGAGSARSRSALEHIVADSATSPGAHRIGPLGRLAASGTGSSRPQTPQRVEQRQLLPDPVEAHPRDRVGQDLETSAPRLGSRGIVPVR